MTIDLLHPSREQLLLKWPEVKKLRDISPWTTEAELAWLAEAASRGVNYAAEVGSYKGKSARAICMGICEACTTPSHVWAVDRFQDGTMDDFLRNLKSEMDGDFLTLHPVESELGARCVSSDIEDDLLDFLFIDASHEKHDVLRDLQLWTPLVKDGGLIALHDCFPQDENNGIHQALLEFRPDFHLAIDSIACFYK